MSAGKDRTLLFRLYLLLVTGLIAVATILDFGFRALQARLAPAGEPWRDATFRMITERLAATSASEHAGLAVQLTRELGVPIQILESGSVVDSADSEAGMPRELVDAEGRASWILELPSHGTLVRVGGMDLPEEHPWLGLVPPLFYLSLFIVVGLWLRPLLRDLDTITASTRAFAADYREPQQTAGSVSNLTELAENFDAMSSRLGALIQGQKELTSALSHEMRTPLARIRFALAVIGDKASDSERAELTAIAEDVQEIDRLISTMLNYARLDHPDTRMHWQETPADPWLKKTVEKCRLPECRVDIVAADEVRNLNIDVRLMTLALSNLLVNACRHANSRVEVSITKIGDNYRLAVDDDGPGIPEEDRARVFKAFTRLDGSRNRDTGGYGLGLAIVARIANLHGGMANAGRSGSLGGASMTITWPGRP
ncbi:MAG: ATP-binding protein [Gammaproteobacteria bacterium]|nr:ATP-binding protein [Gammaproteobacteria bacterium]MDH4314002.1 ATP-binding protein [Gammaproteobacteria bacterium]MDH5212736.1 ATP-binding protein [Gammaproteobacteria bacterium]